MDPLGFQQPLCKVYVGFYENHAFYINVFWYFVPILRHQARLSKFAARFVNPWDVNAVCVPEMNVRIDYFSFRSMCVLKHGAGVERRRGWTMFTSCNNWE
jgi:hypothetical protein